jgi:hypothetical protein
MKVTTLIDQINERKSPRLVGTGRDFRAKPGKNKSPKQPGSLAGSGKPMRAKAGFVGEDRETRWAHGPDRDKAIWRADLDDPDYTTVWVNIRDVFKLTHGDFRLDLDDPNGGENAIKGRIPRAHEHWDQGGHMDLAMLALSEPNGQPEINFTNGRHRLYVAYHRGQEYAPVLVPTDNVNELRKYVRMK